MERRGTIQPDIAPKRHVTTGEGGWYQGPDARAAGRARGMERGLAPWVRDRWIRDADALPCPLHRLGEDHDADLGHVFDRPAQAFATDARSP